MRKNLTIKDIAAELGMSHATVSRALNNSTRISQKTRDLVHETSQRLGYIPNASARTIRGDGTKWFGLIVPEIENAFYSNITVAHADLCRTQDARMMFAVSNEDPEIERREVRAFLESRVSGIVVTLTGKPHPETLAMLNSLPVVKLIRRMEGLERPLVTFAEAEVCRDACNHLLDLGHSRLAYIGTDLSVSSGRERVRGFVAAKQDRGIPVDEALLELVPPPEVEGYNACMRLLALDAPPTGLLVAGSQLTLGVLSALRDAGKSVPGDMSVIAYGDVGWHRVHTPQITAIDLPATSIVDKAFALLDEQRSGKLFNRSLDLEMPANLVIRQSTAPPKS